MYAASDPHRMESVPLKTGLESEVSTVRKRSFLPVGVARDPKRTLKLWSTSGAGTAAAGKSICATRLK